MSQCGYVTTDLRVGHMSSASNGTFRFPANMEAVVRACAGRKKHILDVVDIFIYLKLHSLMTFEFVHCFEINRH